MSGADWHSLQRIGERIGDGLAWSAFRLRFATAAGRDRRIVVLQSNDDRYAPLHAIAGEANRRYAERMGYAYAHFQGNISPRPRTSNFNRYFLLREALRWTSHRWALWMDADAIVIDPTIRLEPIIDANPGKLVIACRGTDRGEHDINNGIFLFNLRHAEAPRFLRYMIIAAGRVRPDNSRFESDQRHMQAWLKRRRRHDGTIACLKRYAGSDGNKFNYDGPFIRHVLRRSGTPEQRIERMEHIRRICMARFAASEHPPPNLPATHARNYT